MLTSQGQQHLTPRTPNLNVDRVAFAVGAQTLGINAHQTSCHPWLERRKADLKAMKRLRLRGPVTAKITRIFKTDAEVS